MVALDEVEGATRVTQPFRQYLVGFDDFRWLHTEGVEQVAVDGDFPLFAGDKVGHAFAQVVSQLGL